MLQVILLFITKHCDLFEHRITMLVLNTIFLIFKKAVIRKVNITRIFVVRFFSWSDLELGQGKERLKKVRQGLDLLQGSPEGRIVNEGAFGRFQLPLKEFQIKLSCPQNSGKRRRRRKTADVQEGQDCHQVVHLGTVLLNFLGL